MTGTHTPVISNSVIQITYLIVLLFRNYQININDKTQVRNRWTWNKSYFSPLTLVDSPLSWCFSKHWMPFSFCWSKENRVLKFSPTWGLFQIILKTIWGQTLFPVRTTARSPEDNFVLIIEFYNASVVNFTVRSSIKFLSNVNKCCCSTILSC